MASVMSGSASAPESEALNLLAAIGNPEKSKQVLEQIQIEKKLALEAKAEAAKVRDYAEQSLAAMNAKSAELQKQEESLARKEKAFDTKVATFESTSQADKDTMAQERRTLDAAFENQKAREAAIVKLEGSLASREAAVKAEEERIAILQSQLNERIATIKAQARAELDKQLAAIG